MPKYARSAIGLAREKGWLAGKNPMVLVILAGLFGYFLPKQKVTKVGLQLCVLIRGNSSSSLGRLSDRTVTIEDWKCFLNESQTNTDRNRFM